LPIDIFVPTRAVPRMLDIIRSHKTVNLHVVGKNWDAANAEAEKLANSDDNAFMVHPFNQVFEIAIVINPCVCYIYNNH
jgi:threonine dehydratase